MGLFGLFKRKSDPKNSKHKTTQTISATKPKTTKPENITNGLKNSSAIIEASGKEIATSLGEKITGELMGPILNNFFTFGSSRQDLSKGQLLNDEGSELSTQGKVEESLQLYEKALELTPDDKMILLNTSRVLYLLGRDDESLTFVDKVLGIDSNFYDALCVKAFYLSLSGNHPESLLWLDKAIPLQPAKDLTAIALRTHSLMMMEQYKEGLNYCKKGLNINPRHELLLVLNAHILLLTHNLADGYECILKILDINPKNQWAMSSRKTISEVLKNMRTKMG